MTKAIPLTPQIQEQIRASTGNPDFDAANITIFETALASTEPLQKSGSLFENGRITPGVLMEAADTVNSEGGAVPIHTLHQQGEELPIGRLFSAETVTLENGEVQLVGRFFLPDDQETLISNIENGVIDEVSVGLKSQKILCSDCEFDFLGEESDIINILGRTCNNGHEVGKNGAHVRLVGLDKFMETSLVSKGASQRAKILSRSKQVMDTAERERLAANGLYPEAAILTATGPLTHVSKEDSMTSGKQTDEGQGGGGVDLTGIMKQMTDLSASVATKDQEILGLQAQVSDKDKEIESLKAQIPQDNTDPVQAKLGEDSETVKAKLEDANNVLAKLQEQTRAALVASGHENPEVPDTAAECLDAIEQSGLKLHQAVGSGKSSDASSGSEEPKRIPKAFKVNR